MDGPYRLISEVHAHSGPVRSICQVPNAASVITGCQADSPNVRAWNLSLPSIEESQRPIPHSHWVTALTYLPKNTISSFPEGLLVTGCYDTIIRLFHPTLDSRPLHNLQGHTKGILSFSWVPITNRLLSGSWDGTARVWDLSNATVISCVHVLGPHENGVNVLGLSPSLIATTSTGEAVNGKPANYRIRFWQTETGEQVGTSLEDHGGSIRSIAAVPALGGFVTTSNDGTVALRTGDGIKITDLYHPPSTGTSSLPFVLDCAALSTNEGVDLVSVAEDGSVVVWNDMVAAQYIHHPCCVWKVLALSGGGLDGDFITAGDDGVIRYFSSNPALTSLSSSELLSLQLIQQVEEMNLKRHKGPSEEDLAKATRWELRGSVLGKSEGQVMLFNKNGSLIAAQWSADTKVWIEVGEVTDKGDGGTVDGVQYDHVLPVEIETSTGLLSLKLGFNNGENPFTAAQRFIDQNGLNNSYLSQIADWISKEAKSSPTFDMSESVAAASTSTASVAPSGPQLSRKATVFITFDDITSGFKGKALGKIEEFNQPEASLVAAEVGIIEGLIKILVETSYYHSSKVLEGHLKPLVTVLSWETAKAFPAFDLLRLLALHPSGSTVLAASPVFLLSLETAVRNSFLGPEQASVATLLTSVRFFANCYRHETLRNALLSQPDFSSFLQSLAAQVKNKSKPVRIGIASFIFNFSAYLTVHKPSTDFSDLLQVIFELIRVILDGEGEQDILDMALLAFGSIITYHRDYRILSSAYRFKDLLQNLEGSRRVTDPQVQRLIQEILIVISSQ